MNENKKDKVLSVVESVNVALEPNVVFERSNLSNLNEFLEIIQELKDEGKVMITKKRKILSVRAAGFVLAKIVSQSRGFAFASPVGEGEDIFVAIEDMKLSVLGDTVMIYNIKETNKGLSGKVERIVSKGNRTITGTVVRSNRGCELIPDNGIRFNIPIDKGATLGARDKDKVQVLLLSTPRRRQLSARVLKIYGKSNSAKICADAIIDNNGIPDTFSKETILEAQKISKTSISKKDISERLDLRDQIIFTIDGADAKDLDDAVSIKKVASGWELGVHIADVSHYVKKDSCLDNEARERGTSVYFADRVIPMLPKELSNGVCSLNAGEDKLTFSAIMKLDSKGALVSYEFRKSVINSKVRGVYSEVNDILSGNASELIEKKYSKVKKSLLEAKELSELLQKNSEARGNMDLDSTESKFKLNEKGICVDIYPRKQEEAEKLIEQFMIMANEAAALYAKSSAIPFVYRIHEEPDPERIRTLSQLAGALGLKNNRIKAGLNPRDLSVLLKESEDTPASKIISHQVLRTMAKARYSQNPIGHFGLSLSDYCHFTSPIRRYPDTTIHRILSDLASGINTEKIVKKYSDFVIEVSKSSSLCEIRAMKAERDAEKCYMAEYASYHIGEVYDGIISGVTQKGIFVQLQNTIEGFIGLECYPECKFVFDGLISHTDKLSDKKLTIGDKITIQIVAADIATGSIDFTPYEAK